MTKGKIKLELKTLTPVKLAALMRNVCAKLDGNVYFPAPPVSAADLRAEEELLTEAILAAVEGSRASKAQRDHLVRQAQATLRLVADYVRLRAQGDAAILATSGFELARPSGPPQDMGTPVMKAARMSGRSGEVELRWSGVANRRVYQVYMTDSDPGDGDNWELVGITGKISHCIAGLEPYKAYWFRVSAVGALGEGAMSNAVVGRAA